jgi:hypothetical protein
MSSSPFLPLPGLVSCFRPHSASTAAKHTEKAKEAKKKVNSTEGTKSKGGRREKELEDREGTRKG